MSKSFIFKGQSLIYTFSLPELKGQMNDFNRLSSVCLFVRNLFAFKSSSPEKSPSISPKLRTRINRVKETFFRVSSNKGPLLLQDEIIGS